MTDRSRVKTVTQVKSNQICENKRQALSQIKRINWKSLDFRTKNQKSFYQTIGRNDVSFCVGPAGCGKTYLATYYALKNLAEGKYENMIITKPLVEVDGEKLGFLPGDIDEKTAPYMMSLYYNMEQIIGKERLEVLKETGVVKVIPLAYMRGLTITDSVVVLDEAQNATTAQIQMFLTRMGRDAKFIITGDITQIDLPAKQGSGLLYAQRHLKEIEGIGFVCLDASDVIRHRLVRAIINAFEKAKSNPDSSDI